MLPDPATAMAPTAQGADPAWMIAFADVVTITRALPHDAHQHLDDHFMAFASGSHYTAHRRARRLAAAVHRLAWAEGDLQELRRLCPAAALAAMAALVGDLLSADDFAVLTAAWRSLDLPVTSPHTS